MTWIWQAKLFEEIGLRMLVKLKILFLIKEVLSKIEIKLVNFMLNFDLFYRRKSEKQFSEVGTSGEDIQEPLVVVQSYADSEIMGDGFRWRKYGQKVVKGNPYPRLKFYFFKIPNHS